MKLAAVQATLKETKEAAQAKEREQAITIEKQEKHVEKLKKELADYKSKLSRI